MSAFHRILRLMSLATLVVAVVLATVGSWVFGQQERPTHKGSASEALAQVPEKARAKPNPLENDHEAIAAGGKLFQEHCAECHGMKATGTKRGPSLLRGPVRQATPGAIFWILSNGVIRQGMPDWSKLPEPERWQLVRFIKSLDVPLQNQKQMN